MNRLLATLIGVTVAWFAGVAWFFRERFSEIWGLEPNHFGDFVAGVFGPVATFWLILGFFQQAKELHQNSRALKEQHTSLKMASEEHRELLAVMKEQLEETREQVRLLRQQAASNEPPGPKP